MTRRLIAYVHVDGVAYGPDSKVPAGVAKKIGDHAWTDGDEPAVDEQSTGGGQSTGDEAPPRSGRGSGVDAWRAFAEQHELDVAADASREDIIAAAESAELIEREE
ncbi:hypothetical protein [Streptomyces sp. NBC_00038]|uniref:hypothetical protein n=1 Tax=Streptomyces sp. NBC_00038 TaxID=2903615 RepID=UPI00225738E8|nr:hypothetical protein [Streptomyces sp. NBC_00038]MCX5562720.1 hypothetical protein [Streptomyces sp. NBC_00038]MCX5563630.1 hypothetical protein [Streptomyces sp. NBC_00038]